MKKILYLLFVFLATSFCRAGNVTTYPNVSSVTGSDILFDWQSSTQQNCTAAQLKLYMLGSGSVSVASGKTLTASNTLTFTGTDSSSVAFGTGGTVLYSLGVGSSTEAWSAKLDALAALSPPGTSGYVLSSTTGGTLSWNPISASASAAGTNTYTATLSPAIASYMTGSTVLINFANANTAGSSLNLNSLGAKPIQQAETALVAGQIPAGATIQLVFDGTNFQIVGNSGVPTTYTSPLVLTSNNLALIIGSTGGVEAWSTNLDSWSAKSVPSGAIVDTTSTQTLTGKSIAGSEINSGTVPAAQLPTPTTSSIGGIQSIASVSHEWINAISNSGVPSLSQPAAGDVSGLGALATLTPGTGVATALGNTPNASGGMLTFSLLDTDGTLAADSDSRLATQKAVKTYVDAHSGPSGWISLSGGETLTVGNKYYLGPTAGSGTFALQSSPAPSAGDTIVISDIWGTSTIETLGFGGGGAVTVTASGNGIITSSSSGSAPWSTSVSLSTNFMQTTFIYYAGSINAWVEYDK